MTPINVQPLLVATALAVGLPACSDDEDRTGQGEATVPPIQVVRSAPTPSASPTVPKGSCYAIGLKNVVGQAYSNPIADQARETSGAQSLQIVKSGETLSGPPDGNRLILEVNANETITEARCG